MTRHPWWWAGGGSSVSVWPELRAEGRFLVSVTDGAIIPIVSCTGFRATQLFRKDFTRLDRFTDELVAARYNCVRTFMMHGAPADNQFLPPVDLGLVDESLAYLVEKLGYAHIVLFTGQNPGNPEYMSRDDRRRYRDAITDLVYAKYRRRVLVEDVNENYKNGQIAFEESRDMYEGLLWCRSTWWDGEPRPDGVWSGMEPERKSPDIAMERKAHDIIEVPYWGPCGVIEPEKMGAFGVDAARRIATVAKLFGFMWTSHGSFDDVQNCLVTDAIRPILKAHADGFLNEVFPLETPSWTYAADEDVPGVFYELGGPLGANGNERGCQHIYAMWTRVNGKIRVACAVTAPGSLFSWQVRGGFRVVRQSADAIYLEEV